MWAHVEPQKVQVSSAPDRILRLRIFPRRNQAIAQQSRGSSQNGAPKNVSEVRFLLGMAQYSSRFIPNFSELTTPLRKLNHQGTSWKWSPTEQRAFDKLKGALSSDSVLGYYKVGAESKLQVDASSNGLGLILLQKKSHGWKPIECASRTLTETEQRYSQTALFNNPHSKTPMRIERWLLYLQQFDYKLVYRQGNKNAADYLSRHMFPLTEGDAKASENPVSSGTQHHSKHCTESYHTHPNPECHRKRPRTSKAPPTHSSRRSSRL